MGPVNESEGEPTTTKTTQGSAVANIVRFMLILGGLAAVLPTWMMLLVFALSGDGWGGPIPIAERIGYGAVAILGPVLVLVVISKCSASRE